VAGRSSGRAGHRRTCSPLLTSPSLTIADMDVISARAAGHVVELRPEDTRWLRFVGGASEASAFHEPGWLAALTASYGYQSLVLALTAPGGEVIAGLPLSRIRRPLSGVAYVSLPFTDHCPPLARNEDALLLLAQGLERWRRSVGISAIEIRGPLPGTGSLAADAVGYRHLLTLDGPARGGALKPAVARHVRAARRAGVSVQFGRSWEDMQRFYRLHLLTRRRLGVPVQPLRFLRAVWRHMVEPGPGFLALACTSDGTPVAAALFLVHRQTLIYKYGASDASHWELKPNHLLFWSVIERACEDGLTLLDFGKSDPHSAGLRRFKSSWGAEEVPLIYTHSGTPGAGLGGHRRLNGALRVVIGHSPLVVCRALGELLYRYAA
jgi:CelD/BcsL family acetyltransferase involved in cellulose biosynthesis